MINYGLRHVKSKKLMGSYYTVNENADLCGELTYELEHVSDNIWMVDTREKAEHVRDTDTPWYNADHDTPKNIYVGDLEVVELKTIVNEL